MTMAKPMKAPKHPKGSEGMWITVRRLRSGWYHVRGEGLCDWAQPPQWPCSRGTLRRHAFREASRGFLRAAAAASLAEIAAQRAALDADDAA